MNEAQLKTADAVCLFLFGGNATVTLRSLKSGARFTYRVRESDDGKIFFVSALIGANNESDYQYLGHYREGRYSHGRKSRIGPDAPAAIAFDFLARCLNEGKLSALMEVWHEGTCGCCGRKLTVPQSIAAGIGPECAAKRGIVLQCDEPDGLAETIKQPRKRKAKAASLADVG